MKVGTGVLPCPSVVFTIFIGCRHSLSSSRTALQYVPYRHLVPVILVHQSSRGLSRGAGYSSLQFCHSERHSVWYLVFDRQCQCQVCLNNTCHNIAGFACIYKVSGLVIPNGSFAQARSPSEPQLSSSTISEPAEIWIFNRQYISNRTTSWDCGTIAIWSRK